MAKKKTGPLKYAIVEEAEGNWSWARNSKNSNSTEVVDLYQEGYATEDDVKAFLYNKMTRSTVAELNAEADANYHKRERQAIKSEIGNWEPPVEEEP